jgi:hypothetical protein
LFAILRETRTNRDPIQELGVKDLKLRYAGLGWKISPGGEKSGVLKSMLTETFRRKAEAYVAGDCPRISSLKATDTTYAS